MGHMSKRRFTKLQFHRFSHKFRTPNLLIYVVWFHRSIHGYIWSTWTKFPKIKCKSAGPLSNMKPMIHSLYKYCDVWFLNSFLLYDIPFPILLYANASFTILSTVNGFISLFYILLVFEQNVVSFLYLQ